MSEMQQELEYLSSFAEREARSRKKRLSPDLLRRIIVLSDRIQARYPGELVHSMVNRLQFAARHGRQDEVLVRLRQLRDAISIEAPPVHTREEDLHNEIAHLRVQLELERARSQFGREQHAKSAGPVQGSTKDNVEEEEESMVKKFVNAENRVFVIMPFSEDFEHVWKGALVRACQENGFAPLRVDKISLSSWITDDVEAYIKRSDTVITDVTGNNPNVMFELGYALARGKNPIIIRQSDDPAKIPFDIAGIRYLDYENTWQGVEDLKKDLKKFLVATLEEQKRRKQKGRKGTRNQR